GGAAGLARESVAEGAGAAHARSAEDGHSAPSPQQRFGPCAHSGRFHVVVVGARGIGRLAGGEHFRGIIVSIALGLLRTWRLLTVHLTALQLSATIPT